jgi:hypothetical protein
MADGREPAARLLRNSRREATLVLCIWAAFLVWSVGYSCAFGYSPPTEKVETIAGMPRWVFFGVAVPWAAATVLTIVFGASILRDDDLGGD